MSQLQVATALGAVEFPRQVENLGVHRQAIPQSTNFDLGLMPAIGAPRRDSYRTSEVEDATLIEGDYRFT
jgi:hypothetical protein